MTYSESDGVFSDIEMDIGFGGQVSETKDIIKSLNWDDKLLQLKSATLHLVGHQDYGSGAEIHLSVNDSDVAIMHFEAVQNDNKMDVDITPVLQRGDNRFKMFYNLAIPTVAPGGQHAKLSGTIAFVFTGSPAPGKTAVDAGATRNGNIWQTIKDNAKTIVVGAVALTVVGVIGFAVVKGVSSGSGVGTVLKTIIKRVVPAR